MSKEPTNPLDQLYDIVDDLWGAARQAKPQPKPAQDAVEKPVFKSAASSPAPITPAPEFPPFESLWRVADESVDWTDALAHAAPVDGFTSPALWDYFHQNAEKVLNGDVNAYVDVLKAANPLGDLAPYAAGFNVVAESADRLNVSFEGLKQHLAGDDKEKQRYLAGMSLRCARDLMALLPVCETAVEARVDGETLLKVVFQRTELQKVRFSFVDPVVFVASCGGEFVQ